MQPRHKDNAGSASIWIKDFNKSSSYKDNIRIFGSTDNNIYLTGVQLEAGDALTEFEREPPQISLKKCQRYFEVGFSQICIA